MSGRKYIPYQTIILAQEYLAAVAGDNPRSILATVLYHHQAVVQLLIYRH